MSDCLFCKIINKEIKSNIVLENDSFLVFEDIHPKADIHLLIVPKIHIESVDHAEKKDVNVLGDMFLKAKEVAEKLNLKGKYRLQVNVGRDGGQEIDHIHMHFLADKKKEVAME